MKILLLVCFLQLLFSPVYSIPSTVSLFETPPFEAIYQFGDSISDTGNILHENPHDSCCNPPYGQNFFHHPTGRCSNGRLIIDFITEALGLPFLEPYLNKQGNFTHGANFAVAGSTAIEVSTLAKENIHAMNSNSYLFIQLGWFKSHLQALYPTLSGINSSWCQANYSAWDPSGGLLTNLPSLRSHDSSIYDDLGCLRNWNELGVFHNDRLQNVIEDLSKEHPDVAIFYGDYNSPLKSIFNHASALGFEEDKIHQVCCGSGGGEYNLAENKWCGSDGSSVCLDPDKRVSWDGGHMTQRTYQLMAEWLLNHIFPAAVQVT